jgi:hypothetical protein
MDFGADPNAKMNNFDANEVVEQISALETLLRRNPDAAELVLTQVSTLCSF